MRVDQTWLLTLSLCHATELSRISQSTSVIEVFPATSWTRFLKEWWWTTPAKPQSAFPMWKFHRTSSIPRRVLAGDYDRMFWYGTKNLSSSLSNLNLFLAKNKPVFRRFCLSIIFYLRKNIFSKNNITFWSSL